MSAAVAHAAPPGAAPARPEAVTAGARPRAGGGTRVCVPLRLVVGAQYRDAALSTYIKIAALAMRPEQCRAKVTTIAGYLGVSVSQVERGLRDLQNPDPVDGVIEVVTVRRTTRDGEGESAMRRVRPVDTRTELYVWIPARAAEALPARLLRLYAVIAYAQARRLPLTLRELADHVRHESGENKGRALTERQVARLLDALAASGWATVHHRQGPRGRHAYEAHRTPLHAVPTPHQPPTGAPARPDIHDGSAPGGSDGSLSGEDPRTDRPGKSAPGDLGIRRRRLQEVPRGPVDNSAPDTFRSAGGRATSGANSGGPADGSGPTLSARAWTVLAPVRHLLGPDTRAFVLNRIEAEILRQLAAGTGMARITERLSRRRAVTGHVRDGGRWILGVGLPRNTGLGRCAMEACEDGVIWDSGQTCGVCLDLARHTDPAPPTDGPPTPAPPPSPAPPPATPATPSAPTGPAAPTGPVAPHLTLAQRHALRDSATPDSVRAAIDAYGRAAAGRLYGLQLVAQELNRLDGYRPPTPPTPDTA